MVLIPYLLVSAHVFDHDISSVFDHLNKPRWMGCVLSSRNPHGE